MTPLPSAVHTSLFFKIGNELADFARYDLQNSASGRANKLKSEIKAIGPGACKVPPREETFRGGAEGGTRDPAFVLLRRASCVRSPKRKEEGPCGK